MKNYLTLEEILILIMVHLSKDGTDVPIKSYDLVKKGLLYRKPSQFGPCLSSFFLTEKGLRIIGQLEDALEIN